MARIIMLEIYDPYLVGLEPEDARMSSQIQYNADVANI